MAFYSIDIHKELLEYYVQEQEHYQNKEDCILDKIVQCSHELCEVRNENIKLRTKIKKLQHEISTITKCKAENS